MDPANFEARSALRAINIPTWRWSEFEAAVEPQDESRLLAQQQWIYAWMGRREDAVRIGEKAVALDPNELGSHLSLGVSQAYTGDIANAIVTLRRAAELAPALPLIPVWIAYNHISLGNDDEALGELRMSEQLLGNNRQIVYLPELAYSYSRIGRSDDVARVVAEMREIEDSNALGAGAWAMAYLAIGDEVSALEQLEIVAEKARNHEPDQGYLNAMNLRMNFLNDARLEQPEFVDVLSRLQGD
jgi:tetratricopeptide (TPR) repeat protein